MVRPIRVEVREQTDGEHRILAVEGELDLSSIPVLAQHIDGQIGGERKALTVDLSGVTFMDSSGLRLLIELDNVPSASSGRCRSWRLRTSLPTSCCA